MKFFRRDQDDDTQDEAVEENKEAEENWYKEVRPSKDGTPPEGSKPEASKPEGSKPEGSSEADSAGPGRRAIDLNPPPSSANRETREVSDRNAGPAQASGRAPGPRRPEQADARSAPSRPVKPTDQPSQQAQTQERSAMSERNSRERLPYPDLPVRNGGRPEQPRAPQSSRQPSQPGQRPDSGQSERTIIDSKSHFDGSYRSDSDLVVEGTFEGEIDCKGTVTVADGANVSATVRAKNVVIAGSANGEVSCDERLMIVSTGEMRGKAQAATLSVEEGAFFEGEFVMGSGGGFTSVSGGFANWESARSNKEAVVRNDARNDAGNDSALSAREKEAGAEMNRPESRREERPGSKETSSPDSA